MTGGAVCSCFSQDSVVTLDNIGSHPVTSVSITLEARSDNKGGLCPVTRLWGLFSLPPPILSPPTPPDQFGSVVVNIVKL